MRRFLQHIKDSEKNLEKNEEVLRDYPIVMAIDFGMKETRVAFAFKGGDKEVIDITSWPRDSRRIGSAMSVSLYKKDSTEVMEWGYKAHVEKMKPTGSQYCLLKNLKLHLHETKELPPFDIPITLLQAVADYLHMVHEYAVQEALRGIAGNLQPHNFHYCLTVPTRWSDRAKETMRLAAIKAGLIKASDPPQRLMLISEDEAKALYCLRRTEHDLEDKDRFLICDTNEDNEGVELVMFEIREPSAGQARRLKEVARSHGAVCASTALDRHMRRFLEYKLRYHLPNFPANVIDKLMENFRDVVKRGFDGLEDQFLLLPYEMDLDYDEEEDIGIDDGYLVLTASDLKAEVFDPVVEIVLESIRVMLLQEERLGGNCEAIFMFGEFGSSTYMYKRVGQEFNGQLGLISIPPRQELGTVRGAVVAGLNPNAVAGFLLKPKGEQSYHRAFPSTPVPISPAPTPSSTTPLQTIGTVHSAPPLSVNYYAHQDKDRIQNVGHHQQHQQPSTTLGYVPPPPPPALTGRSAGNYQQTLRAPQTRTFPTSAMVSTPTTQANGLAPNSYQIVMAFDFGDKFTKVSYASKGSAEICDIDTRPKTKNYIRYRWAPVVSSYKKGSTEMQDWGHKAYAEVAKSPKDYCMLRNFKLQLDETIEVPPFENGFTPLKVITDYLRKLHEYAVEEVLEKNMSSEFKSNNFRYSLTVPAKWSNRSRNTMRQAAIGAGLVEAGDPFNRLMILTEDDAKAMYCLRKIDVMQFKDKDRFIICDASEGGGVDVVVYEVGESSPGQTQRLQEVARTHSSDCGSDFLEANIETYLERKLRKHRKVITARAWETLLHDFWYWIRGNFKPAHNEEHVYLHCPNGFLLDHDPDIGLEDGILCFSREDLTEVFEPVAADVLEVIWDQLQKQEKVGGNCRAIFMFGEFGSCRYMLDRACQEFKEQVELVAAPPYPDDLANVHGAVYAGLDSLFD